MRFNTPLVSICMPVYNTVKYFKEAVECFLNQTYDNLEIIIVDNNSTDGTWELIEDRFKGNPRIRIFRNLSNIGMAPNWNRAFANAKGEYVVIASADDLYFPDMISQGLAIFNSNMDIDAVTFRFQKFQNGTSVKMPMFHLNGVEEGVQRKLFETAFFVNPFHINYTIFKRRTLEELLLSKGQLFVSTISCDLELFLRFGKFKKNIFYRDELMGYYRWHESNLSYTKNGIVNSVLFDIIPIYLDYFQVNYKKRFRIFLLRILFIPHLKKCVRYMELPILSYVTGIFRACFFKDPNVVQLPDKKLR